ncbi:MAG: hypothetical protein JNM09_25005 [Blastocatellia bacterium]|nr:hypothetical protein [Blastocatellia bacterium]
MPDIIWPPRSAVRPTPPRLPSEADLPVVTGLPSAPRLVTVVGLSAS